MLFASIADYKELDVIPSGVDGVEVRLDLFPHLKDLATLKSSHPLLFTVRRGFFKGTEEQREALIRYVFTLKPDFIDLEYDMDPEFLAWAFTQNIPIILSYHNFEQTPSNLSGILESMRQYPAYLYKVATFAKSTNDALRLLCFGKLNAANTNLSVISMGERGAFTRPLGPVIGNQIDYGFVKTPTAPGQMSIHELLNVYRYKQLNTQTGLFGLIGNPVSQSQGHLFHNHVFQEKELNAVYVKMIVEPAELDLFFKLAKSVGFKGLSVTMPLKEKVIPALGAINTILLEDCMTGFNFDGGAAVDCLGDVRNKQIVILGAGGSAQSIAEEALHRGANVLILNRTKEKALQLSKKLRCQSGGLDMVPSRYDILINCTPSLMPIAASSILKDSIVMDIVYVPAQTHFLKTAASRGAKTISGKAMFLNQAIAQSELWSSSLEGKALVC